MDIITLFLTKLAEPLIKFANGFFALLVKIDKWWVKKAETTKLNIRWMIFTAILISLAVGRETQNTNANIINYNRTVVNDRHCDAKIERLEEWEINRLQGEIQELKELREKALQTKNEIKQLKLLKMKILKRFYHIMKRLYYKISFILYSGKSLNVNY